MPRSAKSCAALDAKDTACVTEVGSFSSKLITHVWLGQPFEVINPWVSPQIDPNRVSVVSPVAGRLR